MQKPLDVIIIGAGVSGIGMASRLRSECPEKDFLLLDQRERVGGTWDLFRYPGVRSDSDMFTYGFSFKPWRHYQTLADGTSIREYLNDTAQDFDFSDRLRFGVKITEASWDGASQLWTLRGTDVNSGASEQWQARFIVSGQGYYSHEAGYRPEFENEAAFQGQIIHPQQWPKDLDYTNKKVVVIGSGATAITVVPAMAEKAAKVTMLQRSPTYIFALPGWDRMTETLAKLMPEKWSFNIARRRNLAIWQETFKLCKRFPGAMRKFFVGQARRQLGEKFTMKDFNPAYDPWDQRLCASPDGDLYQAIREERAEVVTDHIRRFTESGIELTSGRHLDADIVVCATGLKLEMLGGMRVHVDGERFDLSKKMIYKSVLLQDLPNFGWIFGYINLSWTMKADMSSLYLTRLFQYMEDKQIGAVTPRDTSGKAALEESIFEMLTAGYVKRSMHELPRQGREMPWLVRFDYAQDRKMMLGTPIEDARLEQQPRQQASGTAVELSDAA